MFVESQNKHPLQMASTLLHSKHYNIRVVLYVHRGRLLCARHVFHRYRGGFTVRPSELLTYYKY